ncbi:hypothetical protein TNIN_482981 [Trichonephila inaurata madagascariensis]|uniref:Uncharacterized protein n=1 Tax=Trichonephila inaurata madagascariensis TaxID=2747483 RepID=A0A8X7C610_9ARAC|nr:hypothetical protein TNIN_482981 [Trichonephila inaurata madagascariensis]
MKIRFFITFTPTAAIKSSSIRDGRRSRLNPVLTAGFLSLSDQKGYLRKKNDKITKISSSEFHTSGVHDLWSAFKSLCRP